MGIFGKIFGGIGSAVGGAFGGPVGAGIGRQLGSIGGSLLGGALGGGGGPGRSLEEQKREADARARRSLTLQTVRNQPGKETGQTQGLDELQPPPQVSLDLPQEDNLQNNRPNLFRPSNFGPQGQTLDELKNLQLLQSILSQDEGFF